MSVGDCSVVYPIGVVSTDKNVRGRGLEGDTRLTGDGFNLIGCNTYGEYHGYLKFLISGANKGGGGGLTPLIKLSQGPPSPTVASPTFRKSSDL